MDFDLNNESDVDKYPKHLVDLFYKRTIEHWINDHRNPSTYFLTKIFNWTTRWTRNMTINTFVFMFSVSKIESIERQIFRFFFLHFFLFDEIFTGHPCSSRWYLISPLFNRIDLNAYRHQVNNWSICWLMKWLVTKIFNICWS